MLVMMFFSSIVFYRMGFIGFIAVDLIARANYKYASSQQKVLNMDI
jgi:hypothetical protein